MHVHVVFLRRSWRVGTSVSFGIAQWTTYWKFKSRRKERGVESVQYSGCGFEAEKVAELAPKSDL